MENDRVNQNNLQVGEWYTGYSSGFWQLIQIYPKYASFDYEGEKARWKKGDLIGQWCIVKKAFTPKMKKSLRVEFTDSAWLKPVPEETLCQINRLFQDDPKYKERFDLFDNTPAPMVTNQWVSLTDSEEADLIQKLYLLPSRFSMDQFCAITQIPKSCFHNPPTSHLLNFSGFPWELTECFDEIFFKVDLIRLNT
jgi:hypothetical protein